MPGPLIAPLGDRFYIAGVPRPPFIEPSAPVLGREPPIGREWIHEVKHDGWRPTEQFAQADELV